MDLYIQKLQAHQTAALQPTNQSNGTEPVPINIIGVSHHLPFISFAVRSRNSVPSSSSSSSSGNDGNFDIPFRDNPTQAFNGESSPNDDA